MCNAACLKFCERCIFEDDVKGCRVLEVGSRNVNGSFRQRVMSFGPSEYIGIDIQSGAGVDRILDVGDIVDIFGPRSFDLVIATEVLEHVKDWKLMISNMKRVCREDGRIVMTGPSVGFPKHNFPDDFWRFQKEDMEKIFSDCYICVLEEVTVPREAAFHIKVVRPVMFVENDLSTVEVYSMKAK